MLWCLPHRSHLEAQAAGRLEGGRARRVERHVSRCASCRRTVQQLRRIRALVRVAAPDPAEPDWSSFWPAVRYRIETEAPRPFRDAWWLPLWKPVWGHPRMAAAAMASAVIASVSLWPVGGDVTTALVEPITIQDVATGEPNRSVMVYSNKDDVTVIWLLAAETPAADH